LNIIHIYIHYTHTHTHTHTHIVVRHKQYNFEPNIEVACCLCNTTFI